MNKTKLIILVSLVFIIICVTLFWFNYFKPGSGGIIVNTKPASNLYIDGVFVGKTPYEGIEKARQINLKMVPDSSSGNFYPYETKINLVSGIKTVVDREFADSEENSSGGVISFDKTGGNFAGLIAISTPDNAEVWIDGVLVGLTPYNFNSITTGPHKITIKKSGYLERTVKIKTVGGLKLTVFAKLARDNGQLLEDTAPSPTPLAIKGYIIINDTPTGFLRMRTEPGTLGEEIAELKPGQKYAYLDKDESTGWYKIQYKDAAPGLPSGIVGWVSSQYTSIASESGTLE